MQAVAIFGAGELGGAIAHLLARRDLTRTIGLVDDAGTVATGTALDIAQAAPIEGFATQLSGSTDAASAFGSDVIVLAETAKGGEWQGDAAQLLLRQVAACAPNAIVICAGASHRDVVERGIRDLAISPDRLVGTAPDALAAAAVKAIESIAGRGRHVVSCFVGPNTKTGTRTRTASLPVRLGANGIIEILTPSLSVGERVALENAMTL